MLKSWAGWPQGIRWLAGTAAAVLALAFVWALFVPVAGLLARHDAGSATGLLHETALDNARGRLLTLGAGLLAAGALWFTARNFTLSREGQVTDRYAKAVEQLGSDKLDVRIGGIYALERIARDSARDHPVVMEVLAAFIREHSHERWPPPDHPASREAVPSTRPDVQAAVTVVGRRDVQHDTLWIDLAGARLTRANLRGAYLECATLTGADLAGADLMGARLDRASLGGADLNGARLHVARLDRASLQGASLQGAYLNGAHLQEADLTGARAAEAHLGGADLTIAHLNGAYLERADLTRANLAGADLEGADVSDVIIDVTDLTQARWPRDAPVPEGWKRDAGTGRLRWAGD